MKMPEYVVNCKIFGRSTNILGTSIFSNLNKHGIDFILPAGMVEISTTPVRLHPAKLFVNMKFLLLTAVLKKLSNNEQFFLCVIDKQTGPGVPQRTLVFITNPNLITVYNNIMYTQSNISN